MHLGSYTMPNCRKGSASVPARFAPGQLASELPQIDKLYVVSGPSSKQNQGVGELGYVRLPSFWGPYVGVHLNPHPRILLPHSGATSF